MLGGQTPCNCHRFSPLYLRRVSKRKNSQGGGLARLSKCKRSQGGGLWRLRSSNLSSFLDPHIFVASPKCQHSQIKGVAPGGRNPGIFRRFCTLIIIFVASQKRKHSQGRGRDPPICRLFKPRSWREKVQDARSSREDIGIGQAGQVNVAARPRAVEQDWIFLPQVLWP